MKAKIEVRGELLEEHVAPKESQGDLKDQWLPLDIRYPVVEWVRQWQQKTEVSTYRVIGGLGLASGKFCARQARYGKVNR